VGEEEEVRGRGSEKEGKGVGEGGGREGGREGGRKGGSEGGSEGGRKGGRVVVFQCLQTLHVNTWQGM